MKPIDLDLKFPNWNVPPPRPKQITWEAYLQWLEENRQRLIESGQLDLEKMRKDPLRCPVNARFVLKEAG